MNQIYICIDLKSFYASVECRERNLDPLTTNLVVADSSRTEKTICLAVSPSLKQYGLSGRSRLFEVVQTIKEINKKRKPFIGKSHNDIEIQNNPHLKIDYIVARPRMSLYLKYSTNIYSIYLRHLSPEDIFVYSIDEVFADITNYLKLYKCSPEELVTRILQDVYQETGITATAGIGTNLYLAKVAMDIVAKHKEPNEYGVRIAFLNEISYRQELWNHKPLTDFWRIGKGISKTLKKNNLYTMGDIARCSLENENKLFHLFGINAELIIDHAWGWENCQMKDIKSYKPLRNSLSSSQVLHEPYNYEKTKIIIQEMSELLILEMTSKHYMTNHIVLTIGYDISNLENQRIKDEYIGEITKDFYGREIPKHAHGTIRLDYFTSSIKIIKKKVIELFETIINKNLWVRRINISFCNLQREETIKEEIIYKQLDLFTDNEKYDYNKKQERILEKSDQNLQQVIIELKAKYGKNTILIGTNLKEGATTIERNKQIGGHKA